MYINRLWLKDFRSYAEVELDLGEGTCVLVGPNGIGKSNLLEAVFYAGRLSSFRGAPSEALIARDCDKAVVRANFVIEDRDTLVEAEIARTGRGRVMVNRQRLARTSDLSSRVLMTVFAPTDLELVKGGPALRRAVIDDLLVSLDARNGAVRADFERCLRQRNALLRGSKGRLDDSAELTLDVWDQKMAESGESLVGLRLALIERLGPLIDEAYADIAGAVVETRIEYQSSWLADGLAQALVASRRDDVRRGVSLIGPHRDEIGLFVDGMAARTHASQGEQRTLALAIRLAGHRLVAQAYGYSPILLLDDVFSELDDNRSQALLAALPQGQRIITTATDLPTQLHTDQLITISTDGIHSQ